MKSINHPNVLARLIQFLIHPVVVFIGLQVVWLAIIILWIIWFVNQNETLAALAISIGEKNITPTYGILFLTVGCILLGIILVGVVLLFAFAQKQSSRINQQGSFVSSVTHELRSPLASLQLSFETLQSGTTPPDIQNQIFQMVERDIERLTVLVDRILISSKLDRGIVDFDTEKESIAVLELLQDVADQANYLDKNLRERLSIQCPPDLEIQEIRLSLVLILGNLLENAIKYSPPDTAITLAAVVENDRIRFSVEDKGYGINSSDLKRIFKMFERGAIAAEKAIKGTGVGLFIVHSSVQHLGGRVWAESEGRGKGAKFNVELPLHGLQET